MQEVNQTNMCIIDGQFSKHDTLVSYGAGAPQCTEPPPRRWWGHDALPGPSPHPAAAPPPPHPCATIHNHTRDDIRATFTPHSHTLGTPIDIHTSFTPSIPHSYDSASIQVCRTRGGQPANEDVRTTAMTLTRDTNEKRK